MAEALDKHTIHSAKAVRIDEHSSLVERCRQGDMDAMEQLICRYQDRIYNVILKICANRDDAAELTQQTFVKIIEKIGDFQQRSGFYTWAFRIAVNLTLSHCKRKGKIAFQSLDSTEDNSSRAKNALKQVLTSRRSQDPALVAENKELGELVLREMKKLTAEHRTVLVLRDIEGMDYVQIAKILDIETGTVKSRLSRARESLKRILEAAL